MSFLDRIVNPDGGTGLDPELLDELIQGVDEAQAAVAAQSAVIASLQGADTAIGTVNALQQAAIDAQAAVNTAQQAAITAQATADALQQTAIEAEAAANATQAGAISELRDDTDALMATTGTHTASIASLLSSVTNLSRRMPSSIDLRDFVTGALDDGNIDATIEAAKAAAYGFASGVGLTGPGVILKAPRGKWLLSAPHVFPSAGVYEIAVSLEGAGMNETIFLAGTDAEASSVFTFGSYTHDPVSAMPHTFYLRAKGFSVLAAVDNNTKRHGLTFYGPVCPVIEDIRVRGFRANDCTWDQGHGIRIMECLSDGAPVNSQFPVVRDCDVYGCMIGLFVVQAGPITIENSHFQGCTLHSQVLDGFQGTIRNSGVQYSTPTDLDRPWGGSKMSPVVSGWSRAYSGVAGTGLTLGAASGRFSTLTGTIAGYNAQVHDYAWIRITPTGNSANELKCAGIYKVERQSGDNAWVIQKGSNHTSQGGLAVQLLHSLDNDVLFETLYDEGDGDGPMFGMYASVNPIGKYTVRNCKNSGGTDVPLIHAQSCGIVRTEGNSRVNAPTYEAWLERVQSSYIDAPLSRIWWDEFSWPGMSFKRNSFNHEGIGNPEGAMRCADGGVSVRMRSLMRELGAVCVWDPSLASTLSLSGGTNVASITDPISGVVLTPRATTLPGYVANDTNFKGACITQSAGSGATACFMRGTIPANKLPTRPAFMSLIAVSRLPTTAQAVGDRRVHINGGGCQNLFSYYDTSYGVGGTNAFYYSGTYHAVVGGLSAMIATADLDTKPHMLISSARAASGLLVASDVTGVIDGSARSNRPWYAPGADIEVGIGNTYGAGMSDIFDWAFVAVIPRSLSSAEMQRILDVGRWHWPLTEHY